MLLAEATLDYLMEANRLSLTVIRTI
jgi:hypothetical protein